MSHTHTGIHTELRMGYEKYNVVCMNALKNPSFPPEVITLPNLPFIVLFFQIYHLYRMISLNGYLLVGVYWTLHKRNHTIHDVSRLALHSLLVLWRRCTGLCFLCLHCCVVFGSRNTLHLSVLLLATSSSFVIFACYYTQPRLQWILVDTSPGMLV